MRPPRPKRINRQLEVGWDADRDPSNPREWKVMVTIRPNKDDHEHFVLTTSQATQLYEWLGRFFKKVKRHLRGEKKMTKKMDQITKEAFKELVNVVDESTLIKVAEWWNKWQSRIGPDMHGLSRMLLNKLVILAQPRTSVKLVDYRLESNEENSDGDALTLYFDGEPTEKDVKKACRQTSGKLELSSDPNEDYWSWGKYPNAVSKKAGLVRVQCPCA